MVPIRLVAPENPLRALQAVGETLLGSSGLANVLMFPTKVRKLSTAYHIEASLPGVTRDAIAIEIQGHWLHVRVQRLPRTPLGRTEVKRSFPLPPGVQVTAVRALLELGVLTILLPLEQGTPRQIPISDLDTP